MNNIERLFKINKYVFLIFLYNIINIKCSDKIIISLTSDRKNIEKTKIVVKSILDQFNEQYLFEIILILSSEQYENISQLPNDIQILSKLNKIKIFFVKDIITNQKRTLITMKKYKNNPIIIINNLCRLPNGWLDMLINDNIKYPNDAIVSSIQYFFNKNYEIKEIKDGYQGKIFGTFNHVSEMIFNFALINIDLGGILYPKNFFQNSLFYDYDLFLKATNNSEDFWQSAFIIIDDKNLRQSSRIFDFTEYLIDDINLEFYNINKKILLEKSKILFDTQFKNFNDSIKKKQNKIIVSIASYPERFVYLPGLMSFINNQSFHINNITFFFYIGHEKFYNLNLSNVKIFFTEKNLKSHLKYFYAMKLFRDHAIITLDDDLGYTYDSFESLFNAYVENPNIICGRRGHLMTYQNNGELKNYFSWIYEQQIIKESSFNITLTNGAGTIFPPDILNINDEYLPIINETITCDDLTLKFYSTQKGILNKWIFNNHIMGIPRTLPKSNSSPLFILNNVNNDFCINKLNIIINKTNLDNLCVPFKNIQTGLSIYLFDIHNQKIKNKTLYFDIFAYSYCPIDYKLKIFIYFDNLTAECFLEEKRVIFRDKRDYRKNTRIICCHMNNFENNLDNYYFPEAKAKDNLFIKIYNYRKYLTIIFKEFICKNNNICSLKAVLYENINFKEFPVFINQKQYNCVIEKNYIFEKYLNILPVIKKFNCIYTGLFNNITKTFISGIPIILNTTNKTTNDNIIPSQFIIKRIIEQNNDIKKTIIIIGHFDKSEDNYIYNFTLHFLYPNISLICTLKPYTKQVQSRIYCINNINIVSNKFLIENQIVRTSDDKNEFILINEETLIRLKFKHGIDILNKQRNHLKFIKRKVFLVKRDIIINIILITLIIIIKYKPQKKKIYRRKRYPKKIIPHDLKYKIPFLQ